MIRRAEQSDAARIAEIMVYGWRNAYSDIIEEKILYQNLSVVNRYQKLNEILVQEHGYYVYEDGGIIKGFMLVGDCTEEDGNTSLMELVALYVEHAFKRQGIGSSLLNECSDIAIEKGKTGIKLWVFENNISSRKFYERHGYVTNNYVKFLENIGQNEIRYTKSLI